MLRHVRLFGVLVFILGFTGNAWGQNFSDVVVFGDSLSDSRQRGSLHDQSRSGLVRESGASLWRSRIGTRLDGGSNYAFAGACVNPDQNAYCNSDKIFPVPRVPEQIGLVPLAIGWERDPNALYAIWGGVNDVADSAENDPLNAARHTRCRPQASTSRRYGVSRTPVPATSWRSTCPTSANPRMPELVWIR